MQTEHLRDTEGLDEVAATGTIETRWKTMKARVATMARRAWGQVSGSTNAAAQSVPPPPEHGAREPERQNGADP